ncbi:MAG: alcohol dehydrogenase catalytic domain-containing protein [Deltaproteobacteria bacterium]|nr:alcohol dehydrogenase catalytic domain-containing protein [Deltaproteobacteria bacterium]
MRGLWLEEKRLSLREGLALPQPRAREALVRVILAGVCSTDLELTRGYYPYRGILGHEFVGEIVEAQGAPERVGERVVGEINAACGCCDFCSEGLPRHCRQRTVLGIVGRHGAFAEHLTLPLENLFSVPPRLDDEVAVFTEPLAAALEIGEQVSIDSTQRVLVVGAGRLGQLVARVLALSVCELSVVCRHERQRELLACTGARCISEKEVERAHYPVAVDTSGGEEGFALARRALRPRGTLVVKSTFRGAVRVDLAALVVDEISLVGSRCGPFAPALGLLADGKVDPRPLIEARYALVEGLTAMEHAKRQGALKVLLAP